MIKIELGKCCAFCDKIKVKGKTIKSITDETGPLTVIGCEHREVCGEYLCEPLKALPAEMIFGSAEE